MYKILTCLFLLSSIFHLESAFNPYQDVLVNGKTIAKGNGPDCSARYEVIKKVLDLYKRPITVLDIGAAEGYFSFRIAKDYNACVVMIGDPSWNDNVLEKLCEYNTSIDTAILLSKKIMPVELAKMAECEHFDVVLALNVIHHFGEEWQKGYEAILNLGDNIIIETPPRNDLGACGQAFLSPINDSLDLEPHVLLGEFKRHTDPNKADRLVWISKQKSDLSRKAYTFTPAEAIHTFEIVSNFERKTLKKFYGNELIMEKEWIPGINLITFKSLNGSYPTVPVLVDALPPLIAEPSTDWFPHNVIVKGKTLHLIDTDDPYHAGNDTWRFNDKLYQFMLQIIQAGSEQEIIDLYRYFMAFGQVTP